MEANNIYQATLHKALVLMIKSCVNQAEAYNAAVRADESIMAAVAQSRVLETSENLKQLGVKMTVLKTIRSNDPWNQAYIEMRFTAAEDNMQILLQEIIATGEVRAQGSDITYKLSGFKEE